MILTIDQEDAQKILNYLAARPYFEVSELVPILLGLRALRANDSAVDDLDVSKTTEELFDDDNLE